MENLHLKNLNEDFLINYRPYAKQKAIKLINKASSEFVYDIHIRADNILNKIYPSFNIIHTKICASCLMHQHVYNIAKYLNELSKIQKNNKTIQKLKTNTTWYQDNIIKLNFQFRNNLDNYQKSFFIDSLYFLYNIICENYIKENKNLTKQHLIFNIYRKQKEKEKYLKDVNNIYEKITKKEYYPPISRRQYNEFLKEHNEEVITKYCLNILEESIKSKIT